MVYGKLGSDVEEKSLCTLLTHGLSGVGSKPYTPAYLRNARDDFAVELVSFSTTGPQLGKARCIFYPLGSSQGYLYQLPGLPMLGVRVKERRYSVECQPPSGGSNAKTQTRRIAPEAH